MNGPWSGGTMRWHRQRTSATAFVQPTTAFVLSGGGSLGAMQAGQLRALFEAGITPDLVIGVSAGALNGAAVAHRPSVETAEQLASIWQGLSSTFHALQRSDDRDEDRHVEFELDVGLER